MHIGRYFMKVFIFLAVLSLLTVSSGCIANGKSSSRFDDLGKHFITQHPEKVDASAHWLSEKVIVVPQQYKALTATLVKKEEGKLTSIPLKPVKLAENTFTNNPHLNSFQPLEQTSLDSDEIKLWLKAELYLVFTQDQDVKHLAYLQTSQVIDDIYTSGAQDADEIEDLGAVIKGTAQDSRVQFKLWAPTAKNVSLLLFNQDKSPAKNANLTMIEDNNTGVWQTSLPNSAEDIYYQYQIDVYHPKNKQIETLTVTDPYSLSLSTNSEYSHVIDLNDEKNMPKGWQEQQDVLVGAPENNIFYETHIRDFSSSDQQLSQAEFSGKYKAFSEQNSDGIKHLKTLQKAGLNNIHLLPTFDIGTVNEDVKQAILLSDSITTICQKSPDNRLCQQVENQAQSLQQYLATLPSNSDQQQVIISSLRQLDNYNWGYDPFHYTVPEGSYALNPEGSARILEFREMIQSLHNLGFRVIMDVVYNHTHQAGLSPTAVLDKIVPNYYHRLDAITGKIAQSTCCDNTATEHVMMAKLMTDSLVVWARDHKIDGFRFDLMGHQPKDLMLMAREAVRKVDADSYFYGEGWNFGEVANNERFVQASQLELAGSEIGTYTDRLRDAVRGPGMGASGDDIRKNQGIGNGLLVLPNELNQDPQRQQQNKASYDLLMDQLRIGLAGNLANFPLTNDQGEEVLGKDIPYGDQPSGYALDPADTINYVSKHDNQTLWDNHQYRINYAVSTDDRVRMHNLSLSYTLLAQGIPFLHMGSELLRSKSFLRDSYDYADWFNRVDFGKLSNNYNVGLPPAEKDLENWPLIKKLLKENQGRDQVSPENIQFSSRYLEEMIALRMSSPLFRLTNSQDIIDKVSFLNAGKNQQQGLLVMNIDDSKGQNKVDVNLQQLIVIFNNSPEIKQFNYNNASRFQLHPIQLAGNDKVVKTSKVLTTGFEVPPLTVAVFVQ